MEPSNEELTKTEEETKKETILEYVKSTNDFRKRRKKKFIIIFTVIIVIVAAIKIFFGTVELYNVFGYSSQNARYYKVTVNDKQVAVSYTLTKKTPIIPYLVNFNSVYLGSSNIVGDDTADFFYQDGSDHYYIDITSYECYSSKYSNYQVECTNNEQNMVETDDEKYTKLAITRITNPHETVYDGEFVNDIAPYITTKGQYLIAITSKYGLKETEIKFSFLNYDEEIYEYNK